MHMYETIFGTILTPGCTYLQPSVKTHHFCGFVRSVFWFSGTCTAATCCTVCGLPLHLPLPSSPLSALPECRRGVGAQHTVPLAF